MNPKLPLLGVSGMQDTPVRIVGRECECDPVGEHVKILV